MEQESNALALEKLQLGQSTSSLDTTVIAKWLAEKTTNKIVQYPNVARALAIWIRAGACPTELQQLNLWS
jgi:hypothetical protein